MERRWAFETLAPAIHRFTIRLPRVGDEQRVLLQSDVHWDNPHSDRELFTRHLEEAREHDAPVLDNGDFFCAMQGKWDKRSRKSDLRPEHQRANYLDALVETAAEALTPYGDLITVRGQGNHETSILKRHETNLTERVVERCKAGGLTNVSVGGYRGWIVFNVIHGDTRCKPYKLLYHHGYGGGGPVTRGVIQTARMAAYVADADFVWTGHTHDAWQMPIARVKLNHNCTAEELTRQMHIRTAGYKDEYTGSFDGWHIERGGPPKPIGAAWLTFKHARAAFIDYDLVEAK